MAARRTRLAPSPTGALHLGNARSFLINWALAKQNDWRIVLRIEDLDGPRIKSGADKQAIELLEWLGIDWDEGPLYQAHDLKPYRLALAKLAEAGEVYPCNCTRSEIEAAARSAPHGDTHDLRYPGTCCPKHKQPIATTDIDFAASGWRIRVPAGERQFEDRFAGAQSFDTDEMVGDFQVWTKGDIPSYQLAVVVDDSRQEIDCIVRGADLASSTPRQELIYDLLGLEQRPQYWHVPLVRGEDGRRLAKRHGDTRLVHYRDANVAAERIIGMLAEWCGMGERRSMTSQEFADRFDVACLPKQDAVFSNKDDAWLMNP